MLVFTPQNKNESTTYRNSHYIVAKMLEPTALAEMSFLLTETEFFVRGGNKILIDYLTCQHMDTHDNIQTSDFTFIRP